MADDGYKPITIILSVLITKYNGRPVLELRKVIYDPEVIKKVLDDALSRDFLPAKLIINDKTKAAVKLKMLGLI